MTSERQEVNTDRDPFQELREKLEGMGKEALTKTRSSAIKDLGEAVRTHPSAHEAPVEKSHSDAHRSSPPKEIFIPETGVAINVDAFDQGPYTFNPKYTVTITGSTTEGDSVDPKVLDSYAKPLGGDHSLRDMVEVVEDIVAMQAIQEQLSSSLAAPQG